MTDFTTTTTSFAALLSLPPASQHDRTRRAQLGTVEAGRCVSRPNEGRQSGDLLAFGQPTGAGSSRGADRTDVVLGFEALLSVREWQGGKMDNMLPSCFASSSALRYDFAVHAQ